MCLHLTSEQSNHFFYPESYYFIGLLTLRAWFMGSGNSRRAHAIDHIIRVGSSRRKKPARGAPEAQAGLWAPALSTPAHTSAEAMTVPAELLSNTFIWWFRRREGKGWKLPDPKGSSWHVKPQNGISSKRTKKHTVREPLSYFPPGSHSENQ